MTAAADAVALKLPAMWTEDVDTWFRQAEAQFELRGITEEKTKFYHVVLILTSATAAKVKDLIRQPHPETPYTALKTALLAKYELSDNERAAAILAITSLGDSRPSEVMERILGLLGGKEGGILLRYHFLRILPDYIRNTLALSKATTLQQLAAAADDIFLSGRDAGAQHVLSTEDDAAVDRIQAKPRGRRPPPPPRHGLCYYHARFGAKAKKCESPCSWQGNEPAGQRS